MLVKKSLLRLAVPALAMMSLATFTPPSKAEFILFSGVKPENQLSYNLAYGTRSVSDRYQFTVSGKRMPLGAAQINIVYPNYFGGSFDEQKIKVMVGEQEIPISGVKVEKGAEKTSLQITFQQGFKTERDISIDLGNVRNPDSGGIFYFDCQVKSSVEFPLARYVGTWIVSIN